MNAAQREAWDFAARDLMYEVAVTLVPRSGPSWR